jgi:hypothetical protein
MGCKQDTMMDSLSVIRLEGEIRTSVVGTAYLVSWLKVGTTYEWQLGSTGRVLASYPGGSRFDPGFDIEPSCN